MSTFTVRPMTKNKVKTTSGDVLLQAVIKYKELQALAAYQQEEIRKKLEEPRKIIEAAALKAKDGKIVTPDFKISYTDVERENFDKNAAIGALGRKKLEPFLSTTTYKQLRVS